MKEDETSGLTDQERSGEPKKARTSATTNAVLIGIMVGVAIYGVVINGQGFFGLIPLFIVFKMFNSSNDDDDLEKS